jgi:hypothetical protein
VKGLYGAFAIYGKMLVDNALLSGEQLKINAEPKEIG